MTDARDVSVPTTPTNPDPKPGDRVRVNDLGTHHLAVGNVLHREDDVMLVVKLDGIAGKWLYADDELDVLPAVPATQDDLREQLAAAIKAEDVLRGFDTRGEWYARFADAALSVVAPVLEGLRAELERAEDESAQLRRQVVDERVQATRTSQELFAKWRGERDSERESRIAWALEADRLDQEQTHLIKAVLGLTDQRATFSSLLRGMARRVGQKREEIRELAAHLPCGWCNGTGIAPEESFGHDGDGAPVVDGDQPCPEGCRPPASDQTRATPDDTALTVAMSAARKVSILQRARIVMAMLDALAKAGLLAPTAVISDLRATAADLLTADDVTDHDRVAAQTLTDYADRLGKAAHSSVQGDTTPEEA